MIKVLLIVGMEQTIVYIAGFGKPTGLWKLRQVEMKSD